MDDPVRLFVDARARVDELERQLDDAKDAYAAAEVNVLDYFVREGMKGVKLDGKTISLRRTIRASARAGEGEQVQRALRAMGMDDLIKPTVNPATLASVVREYVNENGDPLDDPRAAVPDILRDHIHVAEMFQVIVVKSRS